LQVEAVVDVIATLHTRAVGHAVVAQCRHFCGSLGAGFFAANVRDAIAVLEALAPPRVEPTPAQGELRGRLLDRLYRLRGEIDARSALLEVRGGPATRIASSCRPSPYWRSVRRGASTSSPKSSAGSTPWNSSCPSHDDRGGSAIRRRQFSRRSRAFLGVHAVRARPAAPRLRRVLA